LRSREEGTIKCNDAGAISSLFVKGIKCLNCLPFNIGMRYSNALLLRFNGDLLTMDKGELIDTGVSDICPSGYIKENKFYGLFATESHLTTQFLAESNDPFLFISGENGTYTCAATQTELYFYRSNGSQKCLSKSFDFKIKEIETTCVGSVDVLLETGKLVVLDAQLSEMGIISNILNVNSRFIQTTKQYFLLPILYQPINNLREDNMKYFFRQFH
jgi:hypothetical protein